MSKVIMGHGGFYGCLGEPQGVSAWWKETAQTCIRFLSYFFCKKVPLSRRVGYVMDGWISGSEMYVCHTNQIGCTIKHQSNFLL